MENSLFKIPKDSRESEEQMSEFSIQYQKDREILNFRDLWENLSSWLGTQGFLSTCAYQIMEKMEELQKEQLKLKK